MSRIDEARVDRSFNRDIVEQSCAHYRFWLLLGHSVHCFTPLYLGEFFLRASGCAEPSIGHGSIGLGHCSLRLIR